MRIGEPDVIGWMASVDSHVLDFWERYDAIFPLSSHDERWIQHGVLCSMISNFQSLYAASKGAKMEALTVNRFIPERLQEQEQQKAVQSAEEISKTLEARFGLR